MQFPGSNYDHDRDSERLTTQFQRIRNLVLDGRWRTVAEIAMATGDPENSVQAQLRHLRKPKYGSYDVQKEHVSGGLFRYRVVKPQKDAPPPTKVWSKKQQIDFLVKTLRGVAEWAKGEGLTDVSERIQQRLREASGH